ncbi:TcpQ domain-containing protein [Pollutimonas bauzanensis]|uniref:TcpQ domain-containing protein n=1 Tax=Pollutimonas bauzanensis TaxID=658167 RepID=UPI00333F6936
MARLFFIFIVSGLLSACTGMPEWSLIVPDFTDKGTQTGLYSFSWRLSGDRAVAPLQVFDNGRQTWLQFVSGQALPAVFEHTAAGDRPLSYTREGPYMLLDGVWPMLVLRGGQLKSLVERVNERVTESVVPVAEINTITDEPAKQIEAAQAAVTKLTAESFKVGTEVSAQPEPQQPYTISPQDQNLRSALARWARSAGWTFEPEHWAVDADIPIVGSAAFEPGFKLAVQELVASTELADRPLRPCFYSNLVLRIVPYAQQCDRTVAGAGSS